MLERLRRERGLPEVIVTDNGSEFTSRVFDAWAYARGVRIDFIQPGKPVQNRFVESFNGTFRDDCLNLHWFLTLAAARIEIEAWRREYNTERPHSSLARLAPATFARLHAQGQSTFTSRLSTRRPRAGCRRPALRRCRRPRGRARPGPPGRRGASRRRWRLPRGRRFVMRDGKIAERRAWVIALEENDYR